MNTITIIIQIYVIKLPLIVQFPVSTRSLKSVNYRKLLRKRLPIVTWLPQYTISKFLQDCLAGVSVGLTKVPQAIAYAVVAGLEPQYGLYSSFMGCFMYMLFGTVKDVNIGPTAIMAIMMQPHVEKFGPDGAVLLAFLTGCIIFVLGLFNLGVVVQFISFPVTAGFTCAVALNIGSTQLNSLFGIPRRSNEFLEAWEVLFQHLDEVKLWDSLVGCISIVLLLLLKQLSRFGSLKGKAEWTTRRNHLGRLFWFMSMSRNALVIIACTLMAYMLQRNGQEPLNLTGSITQGLPGFKLPAFNINYNDTSYSFSEVISSFGTTTAFLPLICILEAVACAKTFSKGKSVDATQEMLTVGITNIFGSFISAMPITASFSRSAVNNASGVKTQVGGAITGILVILSVLLLTSTFYYIPKAALAAVIICAMINLFEYEAVPFLWKTKKLDLIPFFSTLVCCVFLSLEYGILIGIATNVLFILYASWRPTINIDKEKVMDVDVFVATPGRDLFFPSAEYVRSFIAKECSPESCVVVIDGKNVATIDSTVAKNLKALAMDLILRDQHVIFYNFKANVKETCLGVDSKMLQYFKDGNLEDIIENMIVNKVMQV